MMMNQWIWGYFVFRQSQKKNRRLPWDDPNWRWRRFGEGDWSYFARVETTYSTSYRCQKPLGLNIWVSFFVKCSPASQENVRIWNATLVLETGWNRIFCQERALAAKNRILAAGSSNLQHPRNGVRAKQGTKKLAYHFQQFSRFQLLSWSFLSSDSMQLPDTSVLPDTVGYSIPVAPNNAGPKNPSQIECCKGP